MGRRDYRFTRESLLAVARAYGFHPRVGASSSTDTLEMFLINKGLTESEIIEKTKAVRIAAKNGIHQAGPQMAQQPAVALDEIRDMIRQAIGTATVTVDDRVKAEIERLVLAAVSDTKPKAIHVAANAKPVVLNEHTHPLFEKVLRLVAAGMNVLLVGPAGCGKTTLAEQIAKALKRKYGALHCTAGASESQLIGWLLPIGSDGQFEYVPSEFVNLYTTGGSLFLLDEIDAADPNMLLVINSALANGSLHIPQRYDSPHAPRGKDVSIIAAANTFGTGADLMYAGRNQLDAATLDRFYVVTMGYDVALEAKITGRTINAPESWKPTADPVESDLTALSQWLDGLRASVQVHRLRRVVSTRTYQKAMIARRAGLSTKEIKADLLAGWTRDELVKVGVAA